MIVKNVSPATITTRYVTNMARMGSHYPRRGPGSRLRRGGLLDAVVRVEPGLLVLGQLAVGATCGASLTVSFASGTRS